MTKQKLDGKREPAAPRPEHGAEAVPGRRGQKHSLVGRAIAAAHCLPLKEWKRIGFRREP